MPAVRWRIVYEVRHTGEDAALFGALGMKKWEVIRAVECVDTLTSDRVAWGEWEDEQAHGATGAVAAIRRVSKDVIDGFGSDTDVAEMLVAMRDEDKHGG